MRVSLLTAVALIALASPALAATRMPCSGKKGGVERCDGAKFICKDGSASASKKTCDASKLSAASSAKKD